MAKADSKEAEKPKAAAKPAEKPDAAKADSKVAAKAPAPEKAAPPPPPPPPPKKAEELSGLSKIFNSQTTSGRANVAKAVYAFFGLLIVYKMMKPKH